jgi:type IV pilus modification protein PilV
MREKGFTLIEVMIALVILLVGMLGVMGMQYYAITGNTSSRELRIATSLSQDLIEQLRTTPYSIMNSSADMPQSGITISGNVQFQRGWAVVPNCIELAADADTCPPAAVCVSVPDGATPTAVSAVRARTCWNDKNGNNHSVTLDTLRWDENAVP